jgi:hypothetical protein
MTYALTIDNARSAELIDLRQQFAMLCFPICRTQAVR